MKKKGFIFGTIIAIVLGIGVYFNSLFDPLPTFERTFKLNLPNKTICKKQFDNHGGFDGDGASLYCLYLPEGTINKVINKVKKKSWYQLPLSNELDSLIYGGKFDGLTHGYNFDIDIGLPRIQNGYWKFAAAIPLENMIYSYDFYLAIFDTDKNVIYVLKVNT